MRKKVFFVLISLFSVSYFYVSFYSYDESTRLNRIVYSTQSICPIVYDLGNNKVAILSYSSFSNVSLLQDCQLELVAQFALVIPNKMYDQILQRLRLDALRNLILILDKYDWLWAVAGSPLVLTGNEKPACKLEKVNNWTLKMYDSYSKFLNGTRDNVSLSRCPECPECPTEGIDCYSCDLLPDIFMVKISEAWLSRHSEKEFKNFSDIGESSRLPLFLKWKGRSALCPNVKLINKVLFENNTLDLTCNNLGMIWDGYFVNVPQLTGIYRLISPESIEHWLGCTWDKIAYDANLPVHCSNWVRQFTFDAIDVIENKIWVDYRLVYGSLLGAVRSADVIPWTVDGDLAIFVQPSHFYKNQWPKVERLSNWRYSHTDRYGQDHYAPMRFIPRCPVRLTSLPQHSSDNQSDQLDSVIDAMANTDAALSYSNWRSSGYVDLYYASRIVCSKDLTPSNPEYVTLAGRSVKTVPNYIKALQCLYGENKWNETPVGLAEQWKSYSDATR